jgi:hypothetical protein
LAAQAIDAVPVFFAPSYVTAAAINRPRALKKEKQHPCLMSHRDVFTVLLGHFIKSSQI